MGAWINQPQSDPGAVHDSSAGRASPAIDAATPPEILLHPRDPAGFKWFVIVWGDKSRLAALAVGSRLTMAGTRARDVRGGVAIPDVLPAQFA